MEDAKKIEHLLATAKRGDWFGAAAEATVTSGDSFEVYERLCHALVACGFEGGFPDHVFIHMVSSKLSQIQFEARNRDEDDEFVEDRDGLARGGR